MPRKRKEGRATITVEIPSETRDAIDRLAKENGWSRSQTVARLADWYSSLMEALDSARLFEARGMLLQLYYPIDSDDYHFFQSPEEEFQYYETHEPDVRRAHIPDWIGKELIKGLHGFKKDESAPTGKK